MVQKFIPQVKNGDKRVFIIGGIIKGAIKRIPKKNSIVSNLAQGGTAVATNLTTKETKIAKIVAKKHPTKATSKVFKIPTKAALP